MAYRRRGVLAAVGATLSLAGCLGGDDDSDSGNGNGNGNGNGTADEGNRFTYDDQSALIAPDDLMGEEWVRVPEEESMDTERAFEKGDEAYLLTDVSLIEEGDLDDGETLENSFDDLKSEYMVTGQEISIDGTDAALYDEVDNLSVLAIRDNNAVGFLITGQMAGLSYSPDRTTALDAAGALLAHWQDNA